MIAISDGTSTREYDTKHHGGNYGYVWFEVAPDGGAWTLADLNALEIFLRKKATGSAKNWREANVYAEIIYTTPPPAAGVRRTTATFI